VRITVPSMSLQKLLPFVSDEETRYYLNGICLESHPSYGINLVATDGHRLSIWNETNSFADSKIPPSIILHANDETKALLKIKPGKGMKAYATIDTDDKRLTISQGPDAIQNDEDLTLIATCEHVLIDGTFPDWRAILPPLDNLISFPFQCESMACFNASYLSDYLKVAKGTVVEDAAITILADAKNDGTGPAVILLSSIPEFLGILMPKNGTISQKAAAAVQGIVK
jgi:hypothetical protein